VKCRTRLDLRSFVGMSPVVLGAQLGLSFRASAALALRESLDLDGLLVEFWRLVRGIAVKIIEFYSRYMRFFKPH